MDNYVIATSKIWRPQLISNLTNTIQSTLFTLISEKQQLTKEYLDHLKPRYIFFPHWSYRIPAEIYTRFECIIFHMTDLPFGRGGSPLQNLIIKGFEETKISALRCIAEFDAGPIYMKQPLSLLGPAQEIYMRANAVIEDMIINIIQKNPTPIPQSKEVFPYFVRRTPDQSNIANLEELKQVFDYIRMLDAEGYPKAFLETQYFRFEFDRAALLTDSIVANVKITRKTS